MVQLLLESAVNSNAEQDSETALEIISELNYKAIIECSLQSGRPIERGH